mgnify:FL=1
MEERRIAAMHPSISSDYSTGAWNNLNGWQVLDVAQTRFGHETVIDLSGYAMESLTFFPEAIGLQDPGIYTYTPGGGSSYNGMQVLDIITSVPMDLNAIANSQGLGIGPGMLRSTHEFETLLFGMFRFFTANTNIPYAGYQQLERSQRFDSGEPTAADKLYCYRIVSLLADGPPEPDSRFAVPAARQLVGGAMDEESELVYMQRLKRSYELANQV